MVFSRIAGSLQLLSITEGNLYAFEPYNRIPTELGRICASATTDSTQMATERFLRRWRSARAANAWRALKSLVGSNRRRH